MTVKDEYVDDAVAAVDLLNKTDKIDPAKIFILGHSEGGLVAPRIAVADPKIAGVIFMAGLTNRSFETLILTQLEYIANLNSTVPAQSKKAIEDARALEAKVKAWNDQSDMGEMLIVHPLDFGFKRSGI